MSKEGNSKSLKFWKKDIISPEKNIITIIMKIMKIINRIKNIPPMVKKKLWDNGCLVPDSFLTIFIFHYI